MRKKRKQQNHWTSQKVDLLVNGLKDSLEEKKFPQEGRFSGEINYKAIHPLSEKNFTLGFETVRLYFCNKILT